MNKKFPYNPLLCFCFGSGDDVVEATKLANEANKQIAESNNQWNWNNLQAQNQWNIDQWNRENEYNSPANQMQRFIDAGINPNFALGGVSGGNAQQLTSAQAHPASEYEFKPEFDPYATQRASNLLTLGRDMMSAAQEFDKLSLQAEDVKTRRGAQQSRSALDRASAAEKRSNITAREIENSWNLQTFDVRAQAETQKLMIMQKQYDQLDANTEEAKAKKLEIDASRDLIREQINSVIASIRQRDRELDIRSRSVDVQSLEAQTHAGQSILESEKFSKQLQQWNNQNILQYMYRFGREVTGEMSASVGGAGLGLKGQAGLKELTPADVQKMEAGGIVILQRYAEDPSDVQKSKDAQEAAKILNKMYESQNRRQILPVDQFLTAPPVWNNFESW